jgi:hypothetical protein
MPVGTTQEQQHQQKEIPLSETDFWFSYYLTNHVSLHSPALSPGTAAI